MMIGHYLRSALASFRRTPFIAARILVALVCLAAPAVAQPASPEDSAGALSANDLTPHQNAGDVADRVVVQGRRGLSIRRQAYEQARELSRVSPYQMRDEALPRFETPLCPGVSGLKQDLAELMVGRIRSNAAHVGVDLAEETCSPNFIVAFVDDGRALLIGLERDRPDVFGLVDASERAEMLDEDGPVRVWSNIEPLWADGTPLARYRGRIEVPDGRGQLDRLFLPTRQDIRSVLILFDREGVAGLNLVQLADYASMRGLGHTRPASGAEPMNTILSLFGGGGQDAAELTSFDVSYLRSLYYWQPNLSARTKLLRVGRQVAEAAEEAAALHAPASGEMAAD